MTHPTPHQRATPPRGVATPTSEGTRSAQRILQGVSVTPDPYRLGGPTDARPPRAGPPPLRLIKRPADQPSPLERADRRPPPLTPARRRVRRDLFHAGLIVVLPWLGMALLAGWAWASR